VIEDLIGSALIAQQRGQLVDQLQHALDNRVVIERAIGYLMARDQLDAVDAFDRLRRQARSERRKVIELASDLVGPR
jgi:AmiR/NasT family two-component response regulator